MPDVVKRILQVLKLGAAVGLAVGIVRAVRGPAPPEVTGTASWTPLQETPTGEKRTGPVQFSATATATATVATTDAAAVEPNEPDDGRLWVEPVDGACPVTHPVKGNADSGIFHVPGGQSYDRTVPERCYASETDAESDGFRKAKR